MRVCVWRGGVSLSRLRRARSRVPSLGELVRPGVQPPASRGLLVLPGASPLGGTPGVNRDDWRRHVGKRTWLCVLCFRGYYGKLFH